MGDKKEKKGKQNLEEPKNSVRGQKQQYEMKILRFALCREKLLAMKRYSGFLKRPEILETVYRLVTEESSYS